MTPADALADRPIEQADNFPLDSNSVAKKARNPDWSFRQSHTANNKIEFIFQSRCLWGVQSALHWESVYIRDFIQKKGVWQRLISRSRFIRKSWVGVTYPTDAMLAKYPPREQVTGLAVVAVNFQYRSGPIYSIAQLVAAANCPPNRDLLEHLDHLSIRFGGEEMMKRPPEVSTGSSTASLLEAAVREDQRRSGSAIFA